jgi:hypothetical protein
LALKVVVYEMMPSRSLRAIDCEEPPVAATSESPALRSTKSSTLSSTMSSALAAVFPCPSAVTVM